jgi:hypothetical protein
MRATKAYYQVKQKITFEYLEKYRDTPSNTVAKIIFQDHPEFFIDKESARSYIRMYRGKMGSHHREWIKNTKYYQI